MQFIPILSFLTGAVKYVFQEEYKIILKLIEEEPVAPVKNGLQRTPTEDDPGEEYYLNPRFSFDSFVVGKNNEFAYSAALAVKPHHAEEPSGGNRVCLGRDVSPARRPHPFCV